MSEEERKSIGENLSPEKIKVILNEQYNSLLDRSRELQEQLTKLKCDSEKSDEALAQRIERVLSLMTTHMTYIKQLVDIVDESGERLNELEKQSMKSDVSFSGILNQQSMFDTQLKQLAANTSLMMEAIEDLRIKDADHEKFQWKILIVLSIGGSILGWLMAGDHLTNIIVILHEICK